MLMDVFLQNGSGRETQSQMRLKHRPPDARFIFPWKPYVAALLVLILVSTIDMAE